MSRKLRGLAEKKQALKRRYQSESISAASDGGKTLARIA
jgi:hypothetical protein